MTEGEGRKRARQRGGVRGCGAAVRKSHPRAPRGPGPRPDRLRPAGVATSAAHLRNGGSGPRARPFLPRGWLAAIPTEGSRYFQMCRRVCRAEPGRAGDGDPSTPRPRAGGCFWGLACHPQAQGPEQLSCCSTTTGCLLRVPVLLAGLQLGDRASPCPECHSTPISTAPQILATSQPL